MRIGQFWRFKKTLYDFKLCDCIVRKILLIINFAWLKFVRNLIMRSGRVTRIKHINKYHAYIYSTTVPNTGSLVCYGNY